REGPDGVRQGEPEPRVQGRPRGGPADRREGDPGDRGPAHARAARGTPALPAAVAAPPAGFRPRWAGPRARFGRPPDCRTENQVRAGRSRARNPVEKEKPLMAMSAESFVKEIEGMTVLELNNLVKALEEKFGVSAAAMAAMPAPGAAAGPAGAAAAPAAVNQAQVTVRLPAAA